MKKLTTTQCQTYHDEQTNEQLPNNIFLDIIHPNSYL